MPWKFCSSSSSFPVMESKTGDIPENVVVNGEGNESLLLKVFNAFGLKSPFILG